MNRRLLLIGLVSIAIAPATAARADVIEDVVAALRKLGYKTIDVSRTLLGRTRIVATAKWGTRELIINPRTGEILRDILTDSQGNVLPTTSVVASRDTDGENRGSDGSGDSGSSSGSGDDGESNDGGSGGGGGSGDDGEEGGDGGGDSEHSGGD